jgi:hypothetical protein
MNEMQKQFLRVCPFYPQYLFSHIIKQLYTFLPMINNILKAVTEEFHTYFLQQGFNSPFHFFIRSMYGDLHSVLERDEICMLPSPDCMEDLVRW